ncbi:DEAD-domain-containing protein [Epithele typhae]|uniref:DEAD-domain-containing protein n=1 Tax=Epithele typhae TaxID=378194 RepID=UPI00200734D3|nr:DEAD-domain-containing protein [Epithele typhae]KAH9931056.1 DEAD-domain-containing protein [Epithele typhae]
MEDDGIVLNFDVGDAETHKVAQGKKGGRWTDRLKAKRVAKRKSRPEPAVPSRVDPTVNAVDVRPAKRPRKDPRAHEEHDQERLAAPATAPRLLGQVISSLFTSNPKIEQPNARAYPLSNAKPSNAPLDSSTFTGLGLDPLIVSHLSGKMNISRPTSIQRMVLSTVLHTLQDPAARDIFIQSQTGSGKTLSFLLPILQDLLPLSSQSYIDRSIGTLAVIIAPTRELAKQISDVLEGLLKLRLRAQEESAEDSSAPRLTRWLVSGLLTGGENRTHEKARLRKGVPILVSTPGRLLDHLQNTSSFNIGKCRWLVLDEADRLMELGFEETIQGILKGLDGRRKLAVQAVDEGKSMEVGAGTGTGGEGRSSVRRPSVKTSRTCRTDSHQPLDDQSRRGRRPWTIGAQTDPNAPLPSQKFTPPSQLSQKHVVVPLKLRLVTLVALLRSLLAQSQAKKGTKIIVFLSCTDSVDFHWNLLGGAAMGDDGGGSDAPGPKPSTRRKKAPNGERVELRSALLPDAALYRLHGSLPLQTRLASLKGFSAAPSAKTAGAPASSILFCTSVASRGLDLPLVRAVVQYDLPTESGATEYVHRVGRTARAGKGGEAWSFVSPSETEWVKWVQGKMQGDGREGGVTLDGVSMESVLRRGFGGKGSGEYEERATEVQLSFERWVLRDKMNAEAARNAFRSHMRAYATHPSDEKHMFHIRHLHSAILPRRAPGSEGGCRSPHRGKKRNGRNGDASEDEDDVADAEKRMEKVVRAQGRLTKKGGKIVASGTDEFQLAGGYDLEKLVGTRT